MRCQCVYNLCLSRRVSFSTSAPMQLLTTAKHRRTETSILNPSSMWKTQATESRYSFYRIGRVNPESERTTEINFCHWWNLNQQYFHLQSSVLPLSFTLPKLPLYCWIYDNFATSFRVQYKGLTYSFVE